MVNRLISVDESNNLPTEVRDQLVGGVQDYFEDLTSEAQAAATTATSAATTASSAATNSAVSAAAAAASAEAASAPTDDMVAALIANPLSDTGSILASTYQRGNSFVDIRSYGADPSGDSTSAIQSAVNAAAGRAVVVPAGTWTCSNPISLPSKTTLVLQAGSVLRGAVSSGSFLRIEGSEQTATNISATASFGSKTITAPGTTLVAGDMFRLASNAVYDASSTSSTIGEILFVESVAGSVITTVSPIAGGPYTVAAGGTVSKITPVEDVVITGPGSVQGSRITDANQVGLFTRFARRVRVDGVAFKDWDQRHIAMRDTIQSYVVRTSFDWAVHSSQAYGVSLVDATQDVLIQGCQFTGVRHSLSTNNSTGGKGIPRRIRFAFNTVTWSSTAVSGSGGDAIDTHTAAEDIWIENNTVMGSSGQGINFECRSGRITDNYVFGTTSNGISVHNESDSLGDTRVAGNRVVSPGGHGILFTQGTRGTTANYISGIVENNHVSGTTGTSSAFQYGGSIVPSSTDRNVRIVNNTASNCTGTNIFLVRHTFNLEFSGNLYTTSTGAISVTSTGVLPGNDTPTIVSDAIMVNPQSTVVNLTPESGTADNLVNINNGVRGQTILIRSASGSNTITFLTTGNLRLASGTSYALTGSGSIMMLSNGTTWTEINRST